MTDEDGNTSFTGDAPSCLADQKAAARYVKYNILLGNLPGNVNYLVSTGGSGGGAHAAMFAATSDHPDYYDYQIEAGAVGVYKNEDGSYSTSVTIDGEDYEISDGAWGCIAYSAITSLYEADMALAFEYYLDPEYSFKTPFQKQLAGYLSESYMDYINEKNLSVEESDVGFDLDGDGRLDSTVALTIEYDPENHADMAAAYKADIEEVYAGDRYGNNMAALYNPLNYIGADDTADPVWTKIVIGASKGDMSMFSSLNLQTVWLNAGVDAVIEWQWDGGHVPSEILGNSFSLYVDQMYGKYVEGAAAIEKTASEFWQSQGSFLSDYNLCF